MLAHIWDNRSASFRKEIENEGGRHAATLSSLLHAEREVKGLKYADVPRDSWHGDSDGRLSSLASECSSGTILG